MPPKRARQQPQQAAADDDEEVEVITEEELLIEGLSERADKAVERLFSCERFRSAEGFLDFGSLTLKVDHHVRPMWVCPNGMIYLESFSQLYEQARDFLVAIAEPVSRPEFLHQYRLDKDALFGAVSMGLTAPSIISCLERLSKVPVSDDVKEFIKVCTVGYGKVKLVLNCGKYYLESTAPMLLRQLAEHPVIKAARVDSNDFLVAAAPTESSASLGVVDQSRPTQATTRFQRKPAVTEFEVDSDTEMMDEADTVALVEESAEKLAQVAAAAANAGTGTEEVDVAQVLSFEIRADCVDAVRRQCLRMDPPLPMMNEYVFKKDERNPDLQLTLKSEVQIRSYQERSLAKMFGNQRARSGVIVLPCGAGKTLVGITAVCTIHKSALILCPNVMSVEQWITQVLRFTTVSEKALIRLTAKRKDPLPPPNQACIVFTTYSMLGFSGRRSADAAMILNDIQTREWGILVLDEVHMMPAESFRKAITTTKSHCKLGLTATLVREDEKIDDLNYLIGPKLYEANWMDLTRAGFLANVQCLEVWTHMDKDFHRAYLQAESESRLQLAKVLTAMNPNKVQSLEYLVKYHIRRGDKIIVFSDSLFALRSCADALGYSYIDGKTPISERLDGLAEFRSGRTGKYSVLFLSSVGDMAIDVPDANVLIQISSHFGSRRQEAQRLGRILRKKSDSDNSVFNAFFYTIVSLDTAEVYYSNKRRVYLVDQGYAFKVVTDLDLEVKNIGDHPDVTLFKTLAERQTKLAQILHKDNLQDEEDQEAQLNVYDEGVGVRRTTSSLGSRSRGGNGLYQPATQLRRL